MVFPFQNEGYGIIGIGPESRKSTSGQPCALVQYSRITYYSDPLRDCIIFDPRASCHPNLSPSC